MTNHVIYKVKENDGGSFKMKARITLHGNKDKYRHKLKTNSSQCTPTGTRIIASIASIMKWPVAEIVFISAFLKTG